MSETLEERLRRRMITEEYDWACVIGLLDARDKIIAEQRAVIAELSEEPITEFETLRQAHDAQNEVLRQKQAELVALRAENAELLSRLSVALLEAQALRRE